MTESVAQNLSSTFTFRGNVERVSSTVVVANPAADTEPSRGFSREDFENALDKASRPLKGRLAHVPYSSDDFIREKKEEVELEDSQS